MEEHINRHSVLSQSINYMHQTLMATSIFTLVNNTKGPVPMQKFGNLSLVLMLKFGNVELHELLRETRSRDISLLDETPDSCQQHIKAI